MVLACGCAIVILQACIYVAACCGRQVICSIMTCHSTFLIADAPKLHAQQRQMIVGRRVSQAAASLLRIICWLYHPSDPPHPFNLHAQHTVSPTILTSPPPPTHTRLNHTHTHTHTSDNHHTPTCLPLPAPGAVQCWRTTACSSSCTSAGRIQRRPSSTAPGSHHMCCVCACGMQAAPTPSC